MNASEWIRDSLQAIGIQAAEQPITSDQFQTGIRYANRLMQSYDSLGLGYTIIANANDEITIPPFAEEWAVFALASRLSSQFGPNDTIAEIRANERTAYLQMLKHIDTDMAASYPSILPIGSGNECGRLSGRFFPGDPEFITTEQGDYIITEDS